MKYILLHVFAFSLCCTIVASLNVSRVTCFSFVLCTSPLLILMCVMMNYRYLVKLLISINCVQYINTSNTLITSVMQLLHNELKTQANINL